MDFSELNNQEKRCLFEFIAHLAILAGQVMNEDDFMHYHGVVLGFLEDAALLDDFMAVAANIKDFQGVTGRA